MTSSAGAAPPFSSAGYSGGISPSPSGGGSPLAGGDLSRAPASGDYSPAAARQSSWNGMSFPPAANDYGAQRTTTPVGSPTPPFAPPAAPAAAPCAAHPVTPTAAATAVPFGAASGSPAPPPPPPSASPAHPSAAAPAFGGGGAAAAPADIPVAQREDAAARHPGGPEGGCSGQSGDIPVAQREDAVASLEYEAQARLRDPVYGCVGVICLLQKEMVALQEQLKDIEASSLSSSPNATHSSTISGDGAMYGIESSAAAVPSVGAAREEGGEC
ncbi:unnamed protein product [Closterium sp. NIES-65]|nr:unnamed protein product [Closterium sp. NIES-65]